MTTIDRHSGVPGICHIGEAPVDLFNCSMKELADALRSPEANEIIESKCNHCGTPLRCMRVIKNVVACAACIAKDRKATVMQRADKVWNRVCPDRFKKTDIKHKEFPASIHEALIKDFQWHYEVSEEGHDGPKVVIPPQSLFLYGPTGTSKTRVAMLLLESALVQGRSIGVLWPEKVRSLTQGYDSSTFDLYASYDVLLMDDCLLTACRESKMIDAIKMLVDVRQREERPMIITSQIGTEDELKDAKEFGDAKTADIERIKALLRRLREDFRVVPFAQSKPAEKGELDY